MYRVGWGLTPFPLGKSRAPWFCHALPRIFSCPCLLAPGGFSPAWYLWSSICLHWLPLCSFHSWKTHHPFLSMVINYEADNMYTTKIKPFLPTLQQLVNSSLVVLISLFPSCEMYHLSPDIKGECPAVPDHSSFSHGDHAWTRPFPQRII